jgi:hypothetical protein
MSNLSAKRFELGSDIEELVRQILGNSLLGPSLAQLECSAGANKRCGRLILEPEGV